MEPLIRLEIQSTNEPPALQSQPWLRALGKAHDAEKVGLGKLFEWVNGTIATPLAPRRPAPYLQTQAQKDQRDELEKRSRDVRHVLGAGELWTALRLDATRWTPRDGIGAATLGLALPQPGQPDAFVGTTIGGHAYDDCCAAVRAVSQRTAITAAETLAIEAQNPAPQLVLPVWLGMHLDPSKYEYTCMVVDIVTATAALATHRLKQKMMVPRPYDDIFKAHPVKPMLEPGHTAYPGGHSLICHALAVVLTDLAGGRSEVRMALDLAAASVALNREKAGIHTHLDTFAGERLGRALGQAVIAAVGDPVHFAAWSAIYAGAAQEWNP